MIGSNVHRIMSPIIVALGAVALAGCGGGEEPIAAQAPAADAVAGCSPMQPGINARFLLCWRPNARDRGSFAFRGRGRIPIAYPYEGPAGHWTGGFLSPDGRTLLVQWTAECEVPFAFFVSARGGTPRVVTGERSLEQARPSIAHGWTANGDAIIEVIPGCSEARAHQQTEIWLISPAGQRRLLGRSGAG